VADAQILDEILCPGEQSRVRQTAARPGEHIGRRPPLLDEEDLLPFVLVETAGKLHVDQPRLVS
jgi:hypothetical protein